MFAHPSLLKWTVIAHGVLTGWLMVNGVGHQGAVLYRARKGMLEPGTLTPLLMVGWGLIAAGLAAWWTISPLKAPASPLVWPALASLGLLVVVLIGIGWKYGWGFLRGSAIVGLVDLVMLVCVAWASA